MRHVPRMWRSPFGQFARSYGISRLSRTMRAAGYPVTADAIYKWIAGRHEPRLSHARAIERISFETPTPIAYHQVYDHIVEVRTQLP